MIVKICGVCTIGDALAAVEAGADIIGLNFYPLSARYVEPPVAARISHAIRKAAPRVVRAGVFVNAGTQAVRDLIELCDLDVAQLSGDETPAALAALGGRGFKAIRRPGDAAGFARNGEPAILLDANVPGSYGGAGERADWAAAAELAEQYPLLLAGGLTPGNVAEAVATVRPWGVDVASGVESGPGVKDAGKMAAFVRAAKGSIK